MKPTKSIPSVKAQPEGDWVRAVVSGPINEDAKSTLQALVDSAPKKVILDMGGVTHLNSCGIRDWSIFLKALRANSEVVFERCTDEVVRTMNMVTNFHGRLPVRSLYRAYGCDHCGHEQNELFESGKDFQAGTVPKTAAKACAKCGKTTEPFEADEEFFQFLSAS